MINLLLDIDDVIYPWSKALHTELVVHWGETKDYQTYWETENSPYNSMYWENMVRIESVYSTFVPRKEDIILLHILAKKFNIYYVTNRPKEVYFTTQRYFERYNFPSRENLIFTNGKSKGEICKNLNIKFAVDDIRRNIYSMLSCGVEVWVMDQIWNKDIDCCKRIFDFQELKSLL